MLTGNEIRIQVESGRIVIHPYDEACIGPNSYDVRLDSELVVYDEVILDAKRKNRCHAIRIPESGYVLQPGRLYLGKTVEYTESPFHIPMYEGRSSLGRLGVFSHVTAGFGDVGFKGAWTLEMSVVQPVRIYPGMRIGQIYWHNPDGQILARYNGKYQGQTDPTASRLWLDREWEEEKQVKTPEEIVRSLDLCSYEGLCDERCAYARVASCELSLKTDAMNLILSLLPKNEEGSDPCHEPEPWTRQRVLAEAEKCVCGGREQDYGSPEDSFQRIADLWNAYCGFDDGRGKFNAADVAAMLGLLKIARISANPQHMDSWVDLAGYAACGGEIAGKEAKE